MTVPVQNSRRVISGSGWANPLTHAFPLMNATYLSVWADAVELTQGVDYTVSGVGNPAGYSVTITSPGSWTPAVWVLQVSYPINQASDVDQGGEFGKRFEDALDLLTLGLQTLDDRTKRSPKVSLTTPLNVDVGMDAPVANSVIGWDNTGTRLENKGTVPQVELVADYLVEIVNVSNNMASILTVEDDLADIVIAATNIANVNAVGGSIANVNTVAGALTPIGTVATNIANVNTVAGVDAAISTLAPISADITTVAGVSGNVTTVATNIASVNSAAANMTDIIGAPAAAAAAISARDAANKWATEAEDVPVNDGVNPSGYSAFHWAQKALGVVTGGIAAAIHAAANKTTPVGADELGIADSAASWGLKRLSLTNLQNFFKVNPFVPVGGAAPTDPDMDTYASGGFQGRVQFTTASIPNAPPVTGIFYVLVFETNSTRLTQVLIPYSNISSANMWIRNISGVSWNAWRSVPYSDDVLLKAGGTLTGAVSGVTPTNAAHLTRKDYVDTHQGIVKAWVNFNGSGTVAIRDSFNVSSITDNGTGDYTINFATAMPNTNYCPVFGQNANGASGPIVNTGVAASGVTGSPTLKSTTQLRINTGATNTPGAYDLSEVYAAILGD